MENNYIEFNEVDYIVPAETYHIEYSYLSKQGFAFTKDLKSLVLLVSFIVLCSLVVLFVVFPIIGRTHTGFEAHTIYIYISVVCVC
mgnify:CR=1 FL=1